MADLIAKFAYAELKSVEVKKEAQKEGWEWRKELVGKLGTLSIFESKHKLPGKRFVYMNCFSGNELTTTCGEIGISDTELKITTKNSVYIFKIEGKEHRLWVIEGKME